ncbi:hypothetical protein ET445_13250 [Agromyces protaetiae]|uniref:DUF3558 domain-containing protein n=1 Tax=Agromyces protaetiae TaxID=2509455 RepID=A0A4P6FDF9_9MICO|nr:hypothetical protein [Agromyces protaetiae]QAY74152.1 hypothetical protein ET445_13250 [Agromyces protaetiae]
MSVPRRLALLPLAAAMLALAGCAGGAAEGSDAGPGAVGDATAAAEGDGTTANDDAKADTAGRTLVDFDASAVCDALAGLDLATLLVGAPGAPVPDESIPSLPTCSIDLADGIEAGITGQVYTGGDEADFRDLQHIDDDGSEVALSVGAGGTYREYVVADDLVLWVAETWVGGIGATLSGQLHDPSAVDPETAAAAMGRFLDGLGVAH